MERKLSLYIAIFALLFFAPAAKGEKVIVCGKIESQTKLRLYLQLPINNYYNTSGFVREYAKYFFEKDSFYMEDDISRISCIYISFYSAEGSCSFIGASVFFAGPRDSIHVVVNPEIKNSGWLLYSGNNAAGNNLFYKINYRLGEKYEPIDALLWSYLRNRINFVSRFSAIVDSVMSPFNSLVRKGAISDRFRDVIKKNFLTFYLGYIIQKFIHPPVQISVIAKRERIQLIDSLLLLQPPSDKEIKPLFNAPDFLEIYYSYVQFKGKDISSADELNKKAVIIYRNNREEKIDENLAHLIDIKNTEDQAALWAYFIASFIPSLYKLSDIEQYQRLFPNSKFTPYLFQRWYSIKQPPTRDYILHAPIIIADSLGKLSSFKELLQLPELQNSHVFIDVWASWCFPCIDEFSFNKGVDSFLISHDIKKLYLGLDDLRNKNKWLNAVEKYKLGGIHVLAGFLLTIELKEKLGITSSSIAIPRYMLYNKETKEFTALSVRPSDGPFFYSAMDFILNSK